MVLFFYCFYAIYYNIYLINPKTSKEKDKMEALNIDSLMEKHKHDTKGRK